MNDSNRLVLRISASPTALPDVLRYLIGIVLFAIGALAVIGSLMRIRGMDIPPHMAVPLGMVFAGVGTYLMAARSGITLDSRNNTIKTWWGLLIPFHHTGTYAKDQFNIVTIRKELRSSSRSGSGGSQRKVTYTVYPVYLVREKGDPVPVAESRRYLASRKNAEAAAVFLDLGVSDHTSGSTIVREAGTLDMSLAERLHCDRDKIDVPRRPDNSVIKHTIHENTALFSIPAPGFNLVGYLSLGFGGVILLIGIVPVLYAIIGSASVNPIGPIALLFGFVLVGRALREATTAAEVSVSQKGISVKYRGPLSFGSGKIPVKELEDLMLGHLSSKLLSDPVLLARSDRAVLIFGKGLDQDEQIWLHAMIQQALLLHA